MYLLGSGSHKFVGEQTALIDFGKRADNIFYRGAFAGLAQRKCFDEDIFIGMLVTTPLSSARALRAAVVFLKTDLVSISC